MLHRLGGGMKRAILVSILFLLSASALAQLLPKNGSMQTLKVDTVTVQILTIGGHIVGIIDTAHMQAKVMSVNGQKGNVIIPSGGAMTPSQTLDSLNRNDRLKLTKPTIITKNGIGENSVDGLVIENNTPVASRQQWSPRIRFRGQSDSISVSIPVDWIIENQTFRTQGGGGVLTFGSRRDINPFVRHFAMDETGRTVLGPNEDFHGEDFGQFDFSVFGNARVMGTNYIDNTEVVNGDLTSNGNLHLPYGTWADSGKYVTPTALKNGKTALSDSTKKNVAWLDTIAEKMRYTNLSSADTTGRFYIVSQSGMTALSVKVNCSDTAHVTFNLIRERNGARVTLFGSNQTATKGVSTFAVNQNTNSAINDLYMFNIISTTGTQVAALFQMNFTKLRK